MANKKSFSSKMTEEDSVPETDASKDFLNFLVDKLKECYWGEKHLTRVLPKMRKAATVAGIRDAFEDYSFTTQLHVQRLEDIFDSLGENPIAKKCEAMAGLVDETNGVIEETGKGTPLRNFGLLIAVQKIAHYEIATYGSLIQFARTMGNEDIISLLEETMEDEKKTDELLTALAEGVINSPVATINDIQKKEEHSETAEAVYDSVNLTRKKTNK